MYDEKGHFLLKKESQNYLYFMEILNDFSQEVST